MGYCERNKIQCDKNLFNFSGKNTETGKVTDLLNLNEANLLEVRIPRTYKEAIKVPEASKWEDAMNRELKVMHERNVWEFVKPPKDAKTLGNRWVYTLKRNEQNEIVTYKARFVAQGFNQIKGESYDEVFSPVVNFSIIRLFFTVFVCLFKWLNVQIDINNTYLYANLDEVIYMSQPEGLVVEADKVCRLKKAIYGLHQSGRQWFLEMDNVLKELNFLKLEWCNCVYMHKNKLILLLYVDDIILFAKNRKDLELGIDLLKRHFELKVLGKTRKHLGIEFMEVDGKLFIHQNSYIDKVCNLYSKFKFPISSLPIPKEQDKRADAISHSGKCKQVVDRNMTSSDEQLIRFSFSIFQCAGWHRIPLTLLMVALLSLQRHLMMRKANTADADPGCSPLMSSPQSPKTYSEKASSSTEASPDPYVTRSGRTVRPPEKLDL
ncbi:Retrovirus-related Pol polyprotein from transposon TNT 1-94 [Araneus ventricosus]|uniref:Retrovirus-related Pol polyprotein from transposon TNT 1-94 n=1 Tax=Araneus ventricosus TaxID=182803 RepID=A0A4Y2RCY9_ARAVE|nr:Retrovirus-related Pol polyprotein from transposon TNT 1-94 [Araneus ventricosus]